MEDAYTARQAIRILHMSGRVELEARHDEPGDHYASCCASDLEWPPGTLLR